MTTTTREPLPAKLDDANSLSVLLRMALHDLRECERDPFYVINMGVYSMLSPDGTRCEVCLAGAVLAKRNKIHLCERDKFAGNIPGTVSERMIVIDFLRRGDVDFAWRKMVCLPGVSLAPLPKWADMGGYRVKDYHKEPERFKSDIERLIAKLEESGL